MFLNVGEWPRRRIQCMELQSWCHNWREPQIGIESFIPHASYLRDGPRELEAGAEYRKFLWQRQRHTQRGIQRWQDDVIRFTSSHRFTNYDFKEMGSDQLRFAAATSISLSVCSYMQPCWSTWEKNFMWWTCSQEWRRSCWRLSLSSV